MNRDQITAWAREAGGSSDEPSDLLLVSNLELFAALVAAAEREACARKPLTDEEIKRAVLDNPMYGAALLSLMRDDAMVAQLRQAISGIARAVERAHGIGGEE